MKKMPTTRRFSPVWLVTSIASTAAVGLTAWGLLWEPPPTPTPPLPPQAPSTITPPSVASPGPTPPLPTPLVMPSPDVVPPGPQEPAYRYEEPSPPVAAVPSQEPTPTPTPAPTPTILAPPPPAFTGAPPWIANAVAGKVVPGHPAVAVVIDDMGLDRKRSARAAHLPGPLTLSWLPYAEELPAQTAVARHAGHELMLHLPMEPMGAINPGPNALLTSLTPDEVKRRLRWSLDRFNGFVGVNNHMGSRFTSDRGMMTPVLGEIAARGLLWLDSRTSAQSVGLAVATGLNMPCVGRDVFLDDDMAPAAVARSLAQLEAVAKRNGYAVAIGHPHDATIDALARWLPELPRRGLTLVPLSAVVRARHPVPIQQVGDKR